MKTQDIIKYAAMAAAAWFAYRWAVTSLMIPDYIGVVSGYPGNQGQLDEIKSYGMTAEQYASWVAGGKDVAHQPGPSGTLPSGQAPSGAPPEQHPSSPGTATPPSSSGAGSNVPPGGSVGTGNLKDQVFQAAKNESTPNAGLLHFWQWNYYLPGNVARPDPFALSWAAVSPTQPTTPGEVEATPLTIDQWWTLVQPVLAPGMSGVAYPGQSGLRGVNHWGQQPSQWHGNSPGSGAEGGGMSGGMGRATRRGRGDLGGGRF